MRLSQTFALVLVGAFVLPTLGMGLFGRDALRSTRDRAGDEAADVATQAERARLEQLAGRTADHVRDQLHSLQARVEDLRAAFERAEGVPLGRVPRAHLKDYAGADTGGLPAYGRMDRALGVFADFEHRGEAAVWVSRLALTRAEAPERRASLVANLHRAVEVSPALARFAAQGDALDLAWVVTLSGATVVWPPYDFAASIHENPGVVDLDEATLDYVTLAAPEHDPERTPRWTVPYLDRFKGVWLTSVVSPIYVEGAFAGTAGADLRLSAITEQIRTLNLGVQGFPVLVGPDGALIATTAAGVEFLAWSPEHRAALLDAVTPSAYQHFSTAREDKLAETPLLDAPVPGVARIARAALEPQAGGETVDVGDQRVIVEHAPIETAGWGLALVVPESAIVAKADGVRAAVEQGAREVQGEFTVFGAVLFLLGLGAALLLHRVTIRPLADLSRRVEALTFNHLVLEPSATSPNDELAHLEHKVQELLGLITAARDGERAEHAQLGAVLASMTDAVVATDAWGRVRLLNPGAEALLGVSLGRALGTPLGELLALVHEADGTPYPDPTAEILASSAPMEIRERLVARVPAGECAVEVRGAPLGGPGQPGNGVVLVMRDVTHARRIEEELMRVQKLETVRVLAAGIAHDFNNLLAGVLGYVSLARAVIEPESPAQDRLSRAEAAVDRARGLTLQLLTFSRGGEPVRSVGDIRPVIAEAAELAVRGSTGQCDYDLADDLHPVEADQGQIGQVIQNLVLNASQAMPNGGRITVRARNVSDPPSLPAGRYVEVAVSDRGQGMSREQLKLIFDPFYTTKARGSGLGLAVCFSIVSRHGGRIEVESEPGVGSTFRFWLPACAAAPAPAPLPTEAAPSAARILFMDDDAELREVTAAMLQRLGSFAVGVHDGEEAVLRYRAALHGPTPFTGVLLDLTVPGGVGGVETIRRLREIDPHVRAVVCSGYGDDPVLASPTAYGFVGALRKPFTLGRLAEVLVLLGTRA